MDKCKVIIICLFLVIFSCSKEKDSNFGASPPNNTATISNNLELPSVTLSPESPLKGAHIRAEVKGIKEPIEYHWFINGVESNNNSPILSTENLKRGDMIKVTVKNNSLSIDSNIVTIGNTPPKIKKAYLYPKSPMQNSKFKIDIEGVDPDGDNISFNYEWFVNGSTTGYTGETFSSPSLKYGDEISVKITPFDGIDYGTEVTRSVIIGNSPPVIEEKSFNQTITQKSFSTQIHASDPDGDPLTYALKEAPPGMTIDNSGLIKWNVPPDFKGKARVTVSVTDGHGGEASQSFTLEITPQ